MLPPDFVDALLARAVRTEDDLTDAIQDATTYRYIACWALTQWHTEMELRRRNERRLRELLQMPPEVTDADSSR